MNILTIILLSILTHLISNQTSLLEDYNHSLNTWRKLNPCAYSYSSSFQSWTGYGQRTEITVQLHKVVRREFEAWRGTPAMIPFKGNIIESWVEKTPKEIGSHEKGFKPITMEEIYKKCRREVLTKNPARNNIYFETDSRGILKRCQYYPLGCADDCMFGISLDEVTFMGKKEKRC